MPWLADGCQLLIEFYSIEMLSWSLSKEPIKSYIKSNTSIYLNVYHIEQA